MSKVIDILNGSKTPFASFELVPPLKGSDVSRLYDSIDPLMEWSLRRRLSTSPVTAMRWSMYPMPTAPIRR